MCFIVFLSVLGSLITALIQKHRCIRTPGWIVSLALDELVEVELRIELVCFGTRIAEESSLIECFGGLYDEISNGRALSIN